jgi:hypothetical protein
MKLIGTPTSPYTRKARVVLAEKRIDYEFVIDPPFDAATQVPGYNPLGKVPVLVLDDDTTIFDSRVIAEYLDNASPVTRLIPEDTRHRIQTRRWEALADGCTDATVALVMEGRRPAQYQGVDRAAARQDRSRAAGDGRRSRTSQLVLRGFFQPVRHRSRLLSGVPGPETARDRLAQESSQPREARRQARSAPVLQRHRSASVLNALEP